MPLPTAHSAEIARNPDTFLDKRRVNLVRWCRMVRKYHTAPARPPAGMRMTNQMLLAHTFLSLIHAVIAMINVGGPSCHHAMAMLINVGGPS